MRGYNPRIVSRIRRVLFALWVATAVLVCQHVVASHDLSHALGQESTPGKSACDKCFACAELSAAMGQAVPSVQVPDPAAHVVATHSDASASNTLRLAFRSRAPPGLL
jgi:hypothetical protein